jgi:ABC-type nitrate/sulfonate/bicarbonate transport system permease component
MRQKHYAAIYQSRKHLFFTILIIVLPFLFLLVFSRVAKIETATLFRDIFVSSLRLLAAYSVAVILAWVCAALFYRGRRAAVALPIFDVLQSFPTFAALPLATIIWGASNVTVVFFLIITVVWPIFFSIISSLKLVRQDWEEAAAVFNLRGLLYVRKFLLPVSMPGLITGSIVGLGEGWEALIATEIIVGMQSGLGSFFQMFAHNATITALGILGFLLLIFSVNKLVWLSLLEWSHREMGE